MISYPRILGAVPLQRCLLAIEVAATKVQIISASNSVLVLGSKSKFVDVEYRGSGLQYSMRSKFRELLTSCLH